MTRDALYWIGAAAALSALGLIAVLTSQRQPAPAPVPPEPPPPPETGDDRRQRLLALVRGELGKVGGDQYWKDVDPALVGSGQDWCGGFALAMLHRAGLALDREWVTGKGFILVGQHPLPTTTNPKPGDLIYIDQPFQHEGFVENIAGENVHTLDGNTQNHVAEHDRQRSAITAFYSIEPLLQQIGLA